jgi:hypothetical protein
MAIGRISGPLLKQNLLREGVNLAFENDLLYLDVSDADPANHKVGIKTSAPQYTLDVNGTVRAPGFEVADFAEIADVRIANNNISTTASTLELGTADNVVFHNTLLIDDLRLRQNKIETTVSNSNLELDPNGTGTVEIFANTNVYGNIVATGSITADGNITIGDADTDEVVFNAEVASDIIPDATDTYALGTETKQWADVWTESLYAGTVRATELIVAGVDIALRQGNIWYVAENGDDTYSGDHPNDPFASIGQALSSAVNGDTIHIYPGVYEETFPLTVPVGVTVKGHSIRSVKIVPTTETRYKDCFLLNGETTVEDLTIADFFSGGDFFTTTAAGVGSVTINVGTNPIAHTYDSGGIVNFGGTDYNITNATYNESTGVVVITHDGPDAGVGTSVFVKGIVWSCNGGTRTFPDNGYAFRFATDFEVTTRSPYVRNISVITKGSVTSVSDPRGFDAGDAGKGAYIDGAYATANSLEATGLFHSVTFITPGVDGITVTNGARVEWLNSFTYFANRGLYVFDSNEGLRSAGETAIRVSGGSGTIQAGQTFTYYDTDGTTVLATGVIDRVDADGKFYIPGNLTGLQEAQARSGKEITRYQNPVTDTGIKKYGASSLQLDGTEDYLGITSNDDFGFSTDNYTVEGFFYFDDVTGTKGLLDFRAGADTDVGLYLNLNAGQPEVYLNGSAVITSPTALSTGTWYHIAVSRSGTSLRLFVDGVVKGTTSDSTNMGAAKPLIIGAKWSGLAEYLDGNIDEIRIVKGEAKYTGAFAPPSGELVSDANTVLLLHFNNAADSSITIEDDTIESQDLRFTGFGGATADYVDLKDTTDFGGEFRSIASANVYGNYGAYGDGNGVLMYLIAQNFAYIGVGKNTDNDNTNVIQANEAVALNNAKVRYSSVDHKGDFRVGDLFYVNQEEGTVDFTSTELAIDTTDGISITTGSSTTVITGEKIDTGNLRLSGNTIESLSGDINLESDSGIVKITSTGSLQLPKGTEAERPTPQTGMIRYNTDENLFEGYDGNWIALNGVYDLDLDSKITAELTPGANDGIIRYFVNGELIATMDDVKLETPVIEVDDIRIDGNVIQTITTNTDLVLSANGTGNVLIDEIAIKGTSIINTTSNGVLYFQQAGSGYFKIEGTGGFVVPVGDNSERPIPAYREVGMTRFNSEQGYLELWDGLSWVSVAGATGSITFNQAEDLAVEYVLTLG